MARILRGDVFWADLNPTKGNEQAGIRPIIILSADEFNDRSGTIIALAITSQRPKAKFPLTMELRSGNLPKQSWVKISQIRTLSTQRLKSKIGYVDIEEVELLVDGLNEILGN